MTARTDRIDELLRQEIGSILTREVKDPRVGFTTVTRVETTPDLAHARIWISVIGQTGERKQTIAALSGAMPFVRRELGARLRLRRIPNLHVEMDDTLERGTRILHLLDELEAGRTPEDDAPEGETLPTPVVRMHHDGDLADEPPPAAEPPKPARPRSKRRPPVAGSNGASATTRSSSTKASTRARSKPGPDRPGAGRKPKR